MNERRNTPYLLDEPPLFVYRSLAVLLGINKAIVFQQLHLLLNNQKTARNEYVYVADANGVMRWWVYNSYPEWVEEYFPWLAEITLKRIFLELENNDGFVISLQGVKKPSDRRKWYTIDYQIWDQFCLTIGSKRYDGASDQNDPIIGSKRDDDSSDRQADSPSDSHPFVSGETVDASGQDGQPSLNGNEPPVDEGQDPSPGPAAPSPQTRKELLDGMFDAIAQVWHTNAGGWIGNMRAMMLGEAKKGDWKAANFNPPATPDEVIRFGDYMTERRRRERITQQITSSATIQRWFYDYRASRQRAGLDRPAAAPQADPTPGLKPIQLTPDQMRERAKQFFGKENT